MEKTTLSPDNVSTSLIEHLGLVADQINQLGLIELIDERLPIEGNGSKISMGERTAGLDIKWVRLCRFPSLYIS